LIIGGAGYLYGGLIGSIAFKFLQDFISGFTPQYWQFWIGLFLVLFVLGGREMIHGGIKAVLTRLRVPKPGKRP
ncbi:MAG: branched-chain amino acid ABC transporter permease, partial [Hyphomicrobiales bacterium]|nr:branched-chain amino acid ABC transporter permease [Hyphomicrobiales bacterium]